MKKMMSRFAVGVLLCLFGHTSLNAQVHPETAFYWENPYYINPASVNPEYSAFFALSARKQWASFPGTPATFFATGVVYLEDYRTQAGLKILKDKIGYINTLDLSLSYTYALRLNGNNILNMGIAGAWQSQTIDRNRVIADDVDDPVFSGDRFKGLKEWNTHIGVEYVHDKSLTLGLTSQNLMSFLKNDPHIWGGTNYVYARYRTRSLGRNYDAGRYRTRSFDRSYDMEYGICAKQYEDDFQVDGMVSLYVNRNTQEEKFQFSLFGRSVGEMGVLAGVKLISELKFLFTYDYNFRGIGKNSNGTFEVMLTYPIRNKRFCRYPWDK